MVQIEFEIEQDQVLLSDFDEWHSVLNNCYIADSEQEFDDFYSLTSCDQKEKIEKSWEKIFDLERDIPNWTYSKDERSIQATLWELKLEQVKKVEYFTAK